jgi:KAP-like P-loop domain-containing protein
MPNLTDEPIDRFQDDLLDRADYASGLIRIIDEWPRPGSVRIGVYGDWGEGKSSVLRLMEKELRAKRYRTTWVLPWVSVTTEELRSQLLGQVARELGLWSRWWLAVAAWLSARVAHIRGGAAGLDWKTRVADAAFGDIVQGGARRAGAAGQRHLFQRAQAALRKKALVVFVDDLDRTRSDLLPQFLMALRDALDFPNLFYVVAVSPKILEQGLASQHAGWSEPHKFLEKVIEYPTFLPDIPPPTLQGFLKRHVASLGDRVSINAIESLTSVLPANPRTLKLLLRHFASLHREVARYDPDEIDLPQLYLCHLMKLEFPEEVRRLVADEAALDSLAYGRWTDDLFGTRPPSSPRARPELRHAPSGSPGRERFTQLCDALAQHNTRLTTESLHRHFLLVEQPAAVTRREARQLFDSFEPASGIERARLVATFFTFRRSRLRLEQAVFTRVIALRDEFIGAAAEAAAEDDVLRYRDRALAAGELLAKLLARQGGMGAAGLDAATWTVLFEHLARWADWRRPDYYIPMRDQERRLLASAAENLPEDLQVQVLPTLMSAARTAGEAAASEFADQVRALRDDFAASVAVRLLRRFSEQDGIEALWSPGRSIERDLATDADSPFHSATMRAQLAALASDAAHNAVVHDNFLSYLRVLRSGALQAGGPFSVEGCRRLLADRAFTSMLWSAAVARPLNLRTVGTLRENREQMIEQLGIPRGAFKRPNWLVERESELPPLRVGPGAGDSEEG